MADYIGNEAANDPLKYGNWGDAAIKGIQTGMDWAKMKSEQESRKETLMMKMKESEDAKMQLRQKYADVGLRALDSSQKSISPAARKAYLQKYARAMKESTGADVPDEVIQELAAGNEGVITAHKNLVEMVKSGVEMTPEKRQQVASVLGAQDIGTIIQKAQDMVGREENARIMAGLAQKKMTQAEIEADKNRRAQDTRTNKIIEAGYVKQEKAIGQQEKTRISAKVGDIQNKLKAIYTGYDDMLSGFEWVLNTPTKELTTSGGQIAKKLLSKAADKTTTMRKEEADMIDNSESRIKRGWNAFKRLAIGESVSPGLVEDMKDSIRTFKKYSESSLYNQISPVIKSGEVEKIPYDQMAGPGSAGLLELYKRGRAGEFQNLGKKKQAAPVQIDEAKQRMLMKYKAIKNPTPQIQSLIKKLEGGTSGKSGSW